MKTRLDDDNEYRCWGTDVDDDKILQVLISVIMVEDDDNDDDELSHINYMYDDD